MENVNEKCECCYGTNLERDDSKAEIVCMDCGFVVEDIQNVEFNNNTILFGDTSTHEKIKSNADLGGTFPLRNNDKDCHGVRVNRKTKIALRLATHRSSVREKIPQLRKVKEATRDMVGVDVMMKLERIIDACVRPYSDKDSKLIEDMEKETGRKEKNLKNPSQSINRISKDFFKKQGKENRTTAGMNNDYLIAMGVLEAAAKWGIIEKVLLENELERRNIPKALVSKARKIVEKCILTQRRMALRNGQLQFINNHKNKELVRQQREDDFYEALNELLDALSQKGVNEEIINNIILDVERRMNILNEPSLEGPLTNHPAKKIMAMLVLKSVEAHLERPRFLKTLAETIDMTSQGLSNFAQQVDNDRKLLARIFLAAISTNKVTQEDIEEAVKHASTGTE